MTGREWAHGLEYATFRATSALVRALPERVALGVGASLGWVAGSVLGIRRGLVRRHLAMAFAEASPGWRRRVGSACYRHLGREAVAVLRLVGATAERIRERTVVDGFDELRAALDEGRGVVLVTGHVGNWEVGGAALAARGIPLDAVTQGQANDRFSRDLTAARRRLGIRVVDKAVAPTEVLRSLRSGRVAALVADQDAREAGVFVDFLGTPASTARGPALFAVRSGAPLFLGVAIRERRWPVRYRVTLRRIAVPPAATIAVRVLELTRAHAAALEEEVRRHPDQYFWQHRRWKTRGASGPEPPWGDAV